MKVIENHISSARPVYEEALALEQALLTAVKLLTPFSKQSEYPSFPKFLASTSVELKKLPLSNFKINYPNLSNTVSTGDVGNTGHNRISSAIYALSELVKKLSECKYMPKTDEVREELQQLAKNACSHIAVFRMAVFNLFDGVNTMYLAVSEHCEANNTNIGDILTDLEETFKIVGGGIYGYEEQSAYCADLSETIPTLLTEMEECQFPMTEDMCKMFLAGYLSLPELSKRIEEFKKRSISVDVDGITPSNMIEKMELN